MTVQKQVFIEEKVSSLIKNHELLPITSKAKKHNPNFFIKSGLIQGSKDLTRAEELYHLQRLAKNNSDRSGKYQLLFLQHPCFFNQARQ